MPSTLGLGQAFSSLGQSLPALGRQIDTARGDMRLQRIQNEQLRQAEEDRRRREEALRQVGILGGEMYGMPTTEAQGPGQARIPELALQEGPGAVGQGVELMGLTPEQRMQALAYKYPDIPEVTQSAERAGKFSEAKKAEEQQRLSQTGIDQFAAQLEQSENDEDKRLAQLLNMYGQTGNVDKAKELVDAYGEQQVGLGEERFKQQGRMELEEEKQEGRMELEQEKHKNALSRMYQQMEAKAKQAEEAAKKGPEILGLAELPARQKNRLIDFAAGFRLLKQLTQMYVDEDVLGAKAIPGTLPSKVPLIGEKLSGYMTPTIARINNMKKQTAEVFLRAATGAQANESEMHLYADFLPAAGDSKKVAEAKMRNFMESSRSRARGTTDLFRLTGEDATADFIEKKIDELFQFDFSFGGEEDSTQEGTSGDDENGSNAWGKQDQKELDLLTGGE